MNPGIFLKAETSGLVPESSVSVSFQGGGKHDLASLHTWYVLLNSFNQFVSFGLAQNGIIVSYHNISFAYWGVKSVCRFSNCVILSW